MDEKLADRLEEMENEELGDLMRIIGRDDLISFAGGIPDLAIFPTEKLNQVTKRVLEEKQEEFYQYSSTEGHDLLRDYLVEFLTERGLNPKRDELIITSGSQQALDLAAKIFLNPGDRVVVEKPSYAGAIGTFKSYEAKIKEIPIARDGLKVGLLEEYLQKLKQKGQAIKFIYLVPDYSNPSGACLSAKKRQEILRLAREYDFYIIEDTPYSELNYYNDRLDYIKSYDSSNRVILLGSFSKFFVPGFRIAWIHNSKKFIELASKAKQNTDLASGTAGQLIFYQAGKEGLLEEQIKRVADFYRPRLEAMSQALDNYFPSTTEWFKPEGGFFFWIKLPPGIKSRELLEKALKEKVAFVTGSAFMVNPSDGDKYMRLSFSNSKPKDIKAGIKILGELLKGLIKPVVNPFLNNDKLADNSSLNRVKIIDIPGANVDLAVKGKQASEIMSLRVLIDYIKEKAEELKLDLEKIPEKQLPLYLDKCFNANDLEVRLAAENIARRIGRNLGYILAVLKRGDKINQAARKDWEQKHWEYWQQLEQIILAGGLCNGALGSRFKYYIEQVFKETNTAKYKIEIAKQASLTSFIGAARRVSKECQKALVFDFGQSLIKRGLVDFKNGRLEKIYQLSSLKAKHTKPYWDYANEKEVKKAAEQLKEYIIAVIDKTWSEVKAKGFNPCNTISMSIANDLIDGKFVGVGYGKLKHIDDDFKSLAKQRLSNLIGKKIELLFVHDGTAASDAFAGRKNSAILTLGTAIGVGFPRGEDNLRSVAEEISFEFLE